MAETLHRIGKLLQDIAWETEQCRVPGYEMDYAYDDRPLPIGYGQTISQPFIVAPAGGLRALDRRPRSSKA